jgi:hypothetical protein
MRTILAGFVLLVAVCLRGNEAQAAPWCAHYNTGLNDCSSFHSFAQCMAAVRGVGGFCSRNAFETRYWNRGAARRRHSSDY